MRQGQNTTPGTTCPTLFVKWLVCGFFDVPIHPIPSWLCNTEDAGDGARSLSEKTWTPNHLQIWLQKQHILLSYFKTLSQLVRSGAQTLDCSQPLYLNTRKKKRAKRARSTHLPGQVFRVALASSFLAIPSARSTIEWKYEKNRGCGQCTRKLDLPHSRLYQTNRHSTNSAINCMPGYRKTRFPITRLELRSVKQNCHEHFIMCSTSVPLATILDRIEWSNYPPPPPPQKQWWRRRSKNAPFWHHWCQNASIEERGGPDVPYGTWRSKIAIIEQLSPISIY